ncbi:MAG: GNAT family N-acetyltransferase [Planctomycetes bacterium]|nr:GNAT family N-acetyltransferase [Planctomycetota bacterium]
MASKSTLEQFIRKTANSRDANEHLLRFLSCEPARFALFIVSPEILGERSELLVESLSYLLKIGLSPSVYTPSEWFGQEAADGLRAALKTKAPSGRKRGQVLFMDGKEGLDATLRRAREETDFHKYVVILPRPLQNLKGQAFNRVFMRQSQVDWDDYSRDIFSWLGPFLESLGPSHSVQVVTPEQILPELFTTRGQGTMISLGYKFLLQSGKEVDHERLKALIESGFSRPLKTDYFELLGPNWSALIEEDYRAAIVILETASFYYLDKVVVAPGFLGQGLGSLLLEEVCQQITGLSSGSPRLAWRARHDNPYLPRYAAMLHQAGEHQPLCCGTQADNRYVYHFMGIPMSEQIPAAHFMQDWPDSFAKAHAT